MKADPNNEEWLSDEERDLFANAKVKYSRSKDDVWASLMAHTAANPAPEKEEATEAKVVSLEARPAPGRSLFSRIPVSVAAAVVLIACAVAVARFYTRTIAVTHGALAMHTLPDGSAVKLNTETELRYQPYWWWARRQVQLEGEAFFEVAKGSTFTAISERGTTQVLGTSFNIDARAQQYTVVCKTGRVQVSDGAESVVVLSPGEYTERTGEGMSPARQVPEATTMLNWRRNGFVFDTTPLAKVLEELEAYYDIQFDTQGVNFGSRVYTGAFRADIAANQIIEILCANFNLGYTVTEEGYYTLTPE